MISQAQLSPDCATDTIQETCDLCIIGAGIAGLNALSVAAEYLPASARVVIIDAKPRPGGMWTEVYSFSRLHQPHPTFTVGDRPWTWTRTADYLATGREVEQHLERCYIELRNRMNIVERFGCRATGWNPRGDGAVIAYRTAGATGPLHRLRATRLIDATGFDVQAARDLPLSSRQVGSTSPQRLGTRELARSDAPVYVVGGGKTGLDTVHALVTRAPDRKVVLLNGSGSLFIDRDRLLATRLGRWWRGTLVADLFRDVAMRFDGSNEDAIHAHIGRRYGTALTPSPARFLFGLLSRQEREVIAGGLDEVIDDYLEDVVDGPEGPVMVLRSGRTRPVAPGSQFVNCTGHLLRAPRPPAPCLSANGAILSISPRSLAHFLSSASGYFLAHLFFRGELARAPIYVLDGEALCRISPRAYVAATMALSYHNTITFIDRLPASVVARCGLDFDRLFPLHRRLRALLGIKIAGPRRAAWCRRSFDRVSLRFGVACGPLDTTAPHESVPVADEAEVPVVGFQAAAEDPPVKRIDLRPPRTA